MPRLTDSIAIDNPKLDRRVKLLPEDKVEIRRLYNDEHMAIRAIAREYKVDHRTIQFVLFPERIAAMKANRDWRTSYDKKKHTKQVREHRDYKKELHKKGLL